MLNSRLKEKPNGTTRVCKGSYETLRVHMENLKYGRVLSIVKITCTYMLKVDELVIIMESNLKWTKGTLPFFHVFLCSMHKNRTVTSSYGFL